MRYGLCTTPENFAFAKECGYDFVEMPLYILQDMSNEDFDTICKTCKENDINVETVNILFSGITLLDENAATEQELREYLSFVLARAKKLGTEIAVFGSGGARRRPDNMDDTTAMQKLADVVKIVCEEANNHGITVAFEPLCKNDANFIFTLNEASKLLDMVSASNLGCTADTYHILVEENSFESITKYADVIKHVHIACTTERFAPRTEHAAELTEINTVLKQIGYNGRICVECRFRDFEAEAVDTIKAIKKYII